MNQNQGKVGVTFRNQTWYYPDDRVPYTGPEPNETFVSLSSRHTKDHITRYSEGVDLRLMHFSPLGQPYDILGSVPTVAIWKDGSVTEVIPFCRAESESDEEVFQQARGEYLEHRAGIVDRWKSRSRNDPVVDRYIELYISDDEHGQYIWKLEEVIDKEHKARVSQPQRMVLDRTFTIISRGGYSNKIHFNTAEAALHFYVDITNAESKAENAVELSPNTLGLSMAMAKEGPVILTLYEEPGYDFFTIAARVNGTVDYLHLRPVHSRDIFTEIAERFPRQAFSKHGDNLQTLVEEIDPGAIMDYVKTRA